MKGVTAQFEELTVKLYLKQGCANSQIIPKKRLVKFHLGSDGEVYIMPATNHNWGKGSKLYKKLFCCDRVYSDLRY